MDSYLTLSLRSLCKREKTLQFEVVELMKSWSVQIGEKWKECQDIEIWSALQIIVDQNRVEGLCIDIRSQRIRIEWVDQELELTIKDCKPSGNYILILSSNCIRNENPMMIG